MKKLIVILFICCSALFAEDFDFTDFIKEKLVTTNYCRLKIPQQNISFGDEKIIEICPVSSEVCKVAFEKCIIYVKLGEEICLDSYERNSEGNFSGYHIKCSYRISSFSYNIIELEFLKGERYKLQ